MPSKEKKDAYQTEPLDIFGSLPENLIHDILLCLPLRYAVRTSILSKKWRYKWCGLPELTLDLTDLRSPGDSIPPKFRFANIIYQLFTLHTGPITKFALSFNYDLIPCPTIDNLIYFLSNNNIQHLVLKLPIIGGPYKLPSSIFTCLQLRHLTLENCLLCPPPAFKGFYRLIDLELHRVGVSSIFFESLISGSPLLEHLVLHHILCDAIEISAPMLRSFNFTGVISSLSLMHIPLLTKLSLMESEYNMGPQKSDIAKYFASFSAVERLYLNSGISKFWAAGELPARLPFDLNSVKFLQLLDFFLGEEDTVSVALCLIRSFPYLQHLEIQVADQDHDIPALECLEAEAFSDSTFNHLREVELISTLGTKPEMQLVKSLLAKSPVLVRMFIEPDLVHVLDGETLKISVELNSFRRASPEVEVVFNC